MKKFIISKKSEQTGATMVEYAVLVALISIVAIAAIAIVGDRTNAAFKEVDTQMTTGGMPAVPPGN